jgi:adenylate kinase
MEFSMSHKLPPVLDASSVVVVVGPPNAGKGTQVSLLAERLEAAHFSVGDLLREENKAHIMDTINTGALAPSDHIRQLLKEAIEAVPKDQIIVFDGAKKLAEAKWLLEFLPSIGRRLDHVVSLKVSEGEARRRSAKRSALLGRPDDAAHTQDVRWQHYTEDVLPALELYRSKNLLLEVDAVGTPDEVVRRVAAALGL